MKSLIWSGLTAILAAIVSMQSAGCSLIGYGVGRSLEQQELDVSQLRTSDWLDLERGAAIEVIMYNGETFSGMHLEARPADRRAYRLASFDFANPFRDTTCRPSINDRIQVTASTSTGKRKYQGLFSGVDASALWLRGSSGEKPYGINLNYVWAVQDSLGKYIGGDTLRHQTPGLWDQKLSRRLSMITGARDTLLLPLDEVKAIHLPGLQSGRWIGLGVGVAIDVAVVALVITAISNSVAEAFVPAFR